MRLKIRMVSHFGRGNDPLMILSVGLLIPIQSHSANVPWLGESHSVPLHSHDDSHVIPTVPPPIDVVIGGTETVSHGIETEKRRGANQTKGRAQPKIGTGNSQPQRRARPYLPAWLPVCLRRPPYLPAYLPAHLRQWLAQTIEAGSRPSRNHERTAI